MWRRLCASRGPFLGVGEYVQIFFDTKALSQLLGVCPPAAHALSWHLRLQVRSHKTHMGGCKNKTGALCQMMCLQQTGTELRYLKRSNLTSLNQNWAAPAQGCACPANTFFNCLTLSTATKACWLASSYSLLRVLHEAPFASVP